MKEININIEGYNVNGICVGCLNYNRKMFYHEDIKTCLNILCGIDVPDGLSVQFCWECMAAVRNILRFRETFLNSYDCLIKYSRKHTFLNSPSDLTKYSTARLQVSNFVFDPPTVKNEEEERLDKPDVKVEFDVDNIYEVDPEQLKDEVYEYTDLDEKQYQDDVFQGDVSSDDNALLSEVKEKKEKVKKVKKEKKRKKKHQDTSRVINPYKDPLKKLKNLPPNLVELYTMTEEEMWTLRNDDLGSKWFSKLRYKCDNCLISFNTEKLMQEHIGSKHKVKGENSNQCDVCKGYFLAKDHLTAHLELHLLAYRCKLCDVRTTVKAIISKHMKVHGEELVVYSCKICDKKFSTRSKLTYHQSKQHKEKLQCDCCGKVFASKMTLKYHLRTQMGVKEINKPKEKMYIPCKGCNKVFNSKKSYRSHVVVHNGIKYPCPICGKLFQWKRNLSRHTRNHREKDAGALHECRECGKTFSSKDCYNNHMRLSKRHVPEESYSHECSYCGKKFATKWCMVDHVNWEHLKIFKYQCCVCFKAFKTAKIMVAHMNNIHEGKKSKEPDGEHLCEVCGKSYKSEKRLKGHVWAMHTSRASTKTYKCKLCPATFAWQTSIYKHTRAAHDTRRPKQTRNPPIKKQDPYPDIEPARMQYFQPTTLMQNVVLVAPSALV